MGALVALLACLLVAGGPALLAKILGQALQHLGAPPGALAALGRALAKDQAADDLPADPWQRGERW